MKTYLQLTATSAFPLSATTVISAPGDIDGDGRQEFFLQDVITGIPTLAAVSGFNYGDLNSAWNQVALASVATTAGTSTKSPVPLASSRPLWTADIDGDGQTEIVLSDGIFLSLARAAGAPLGSALAPLGAPTPLLPGDTVAPLTLNTATGGVQNLVFLTSPLAKKFEILAWNGKSFASFWSQPLEGSPLFPSELLNGALTAQGHYSLVGLNPLSGTITLFNWLGTTTGFQAVQSYPLPANGFSLLTRFGLADFTGSGQQSIYLFDLAHPQLAVLNATGAVLQLSTRSGSSIGGWTLSSQDKISLLRANGADSLLLFNPTSLSLGLIACTNGAFTLQSSLSATIPGANGASWPLSAADQFLAADVDGDQHQELVIYNTTSMNVGLVKWINGAPQLIWSQQGVMPGWSLDTLANAPASPLPSFTTGDQLAIYQAISNWLDPESNNDIRQQYTNANNKYGNFASWANDVKQPPNPNPPYWTTAFNSSDFETVAGALYNELSGVDQIWALTSNLGDFANASLGQQQSDLKTVNTNVQPVAGPTDPASFWSGQIFDALLWGLAAAPIAIDGIPLAIPLSLLASMVGSALSWTSQSDIQVELQDYSSQLQTAYDNAASNGITLRNQIMANENALAAIWDLGQNAWSWQMTAQTPGQIAAGSNQNRLVFYSNIIPAVFKMMVWIGSSDDYPNSTIETPYGPIDSSLNAPKNSYFVINTNDGYNIYMLYNDSTGKNQYPSSVLTDDLFQILRVDQQQFFTGQSIWNRIQQVVVQDATALKAKSTEA